MRIPSNLCAASAALLLAACIVPPSVYERASWGRPQAESWQDQGRYRQSESLPARDALRADESTPPAPAAVTPTTAAQAPPGRTYQTSTDPLAEAQPSAPPTARAPEAPLYAWDGGVVDGAPQGRVAEQEGTPRGLETPPAGRMHIIELYQQVLDERDALASEVEFLRKGLEETRVALEARTKESQDLTAQVAALEAARSGLMNDNKDIAARLVQAQIRRLEAEKLLLETRIEVERGKAEEAALAAAAQARPSPAKARASKEPSAAPAGEKHE